MWILQSFWQHFEMHIVVNSSKLSLVGAKTNFFQFFKKLNFHDWRELNHLNRNPPTEVPDQKDRTEDLPANRTSPCHTRTIPITRRSNPSPELPGTKKSGTFGRGCPQLIRNWEQSTSPEKRPGNGEDGQLGPLAVNTDQMSDSDIEQIIREMKSNRHQYKNC